MFVSKIVDYSLEDDNFVFLKSISLELKELIPLYAKAPQFQSLISSENCYLDGLSGSSAAILCASYFIETRKTCLVVLEDKEEAAYFYNDLLPLTGESNTFFFPASYKRAIKFNQPEPADIILRTEVLKKLTSRKQCIVVTYPEAIAEKVIRPSKMLSKTLNLTIDEKVDTSFIQEVLEDLEFERVDFVFEPGQYSIRGSIIDIFSFSNEHPYRIDFFGNEVESIRTFNTETQLSIAGCETISIIPNIQTGHVDKAYISFFDFINHEKVLWLKSRDIISKQIEQVYSECEQHFKNQEIDKDVADLLMTSKQFDDGIVPSSCFDFGLKSQFVPENKLSFNTSPQPLFQKNFDLLYDSVNEKLDQGYRIFICSNSTKQIERLQSIYEDQQRPFDFEPVSSTIHSGFIDHDQEICVFTDHQIFERFHKFKLKSDQLKSGKARLTLKEMNQLNPGDYVVHTDHGIGRFDGLTRTDINGKSQEVVKISYKDRDVLFVSIHALHRLSKYKSKDGAPPSINKLGTGAWQRLKQKAKSRVKDIARDLIRLYAARLKETGFAFSPDSYLQTELEASFIYEDTPDQLKSTISIKKDMEAAVPMDRLICGDVGFGKTELAIRAAFKAATDNKQVAILVPTTILAFQHYNTFKARLKQFPVTIEYISRFRKPAEIKETLKRVAEGKVDILIGTHRLTSKDVKFKDLGLLIIDEEQKFGVSIKEKLKQMRVSVDTLTLTATPIPRTLQFSLMGARDLSIINTAPPNRYPILTELHSFSEEIIRDAINYELEREGQVFFLNNRVHNIKEVEHMINRIVPDARTIVGHGQMNGKDLENVMLSFVAGEYDVLIATTIIESGLDIPNANTIIINDAQNYGLSDLHQLRGRVGRSNKKAFCYLMAPPIDTLPAESRRRLQAIESFSDLGSGFQIALQDLDIRGAGNMLGGEQSGFIENIGLETYHKILNEAVQELKKDEFKDLFEGEQADAKKNSSFVSDCIVETDLELMFPASYIPSPAERINQYRELDNVTNKEELMAFEERLSDRFGAIPDAANQLIEIISLRWMAMDLGFEKIVLKSGKMLAYFVADQQSDFYASNGFRQILQYIQQHSTIGKVSERNNKLSVIFPKVSSVNKAQAILMSMKNALLKEQS